MHRHDSCPHSLTFTHIKSLAWKFSLNPGFHLLALSWAFHHLWPNFIQWSRSTLTPVTLPGWPLSAVWPHRSDSWQGWPGSRYRTWCTPACPSGVQMPEGCSGMGWVPRTPGTQGSWMVPGSCNSHTYPSGNRKSCDHLNSYILLLNPVLLWSITLLLLLTLFCMQWSSILRLPLQSEWLMFLISNLHWNYKSGATDALD